MARTSRSPLVSISRMSHSCSDTVLHMQTITLKQATSVLLSTNGTTVYLFVQAWNLDWFLIIFLCLKRFKNTGLWAPLRDTGLMSGVTLSHGVWVWSQLYQSLAVWFVQITSPISDSFLSITELESTYPDEFLRIKWHSNNICKEVLGELWLTLLISFSSTARAKCISASKFILRPFFMPSITVPIQGSRLSGLDYLTMLHSEQPNWFL